MSKHHNIKKERKIDSLSSQSELIDKSKEHISFSFEYFLYGENYGQSFKEWENEKILSDLNEKLKSFSSKTYNELIQDKALEIFNFFPIDSKFDKPIFLKGNTSIRWARLKITGLRRLIGFFFNDEVCKNIFYIVFLDKNHEFAPSYKKHT